MSKINKYAEIEVASAQKVPTGYTRFAPGDAGFTRAVKKAACEAARPIYVEYERRRYGRDEYRQVAAYHAPADVVEQVRQARQVKRDAVARKVARRVEEQQKSAEERKRADLAAAYPLLAPEAVQALLPLAVAGRPEDAPADQYTDPEWRRLGYRVQAGARPAGAVVRENGAAWDWLYGPASVVPLPSEYADWDDARLARRCLPLVPRILGGIADAVWATNRLVKLDPAHKHTFYPLKDQFLGKVQWFLIDGRVSRVETRECWDCEGSGTRRYGDDCWKCGGSGIYTSRTLYEHHLGIGGREYCFHSYTRPAVLSDKPGADLARYGRRFVGDEFDRVMLPLAEYLRLLTFLMKPGTTR